MCGVFLPFTRLGVLLTPSGHMPAVLNSPLCIGRTRTAITVPTKMPTMLPLITLENVKVGVINVSLPEQWLANLDEPPQTCWMKIEGEGGPRNQNFYNTLQAVLTCSQFVYCLDWDWDILEDHSLSSGKKEASVCCRNFMVNIHKEDYHRSLWQVGQSGIYSQKHDKHSLLKYRTHRKPHSS